jgi:hypothetical protein
MTEREIRQQEYERALERAEAAGLTVVADGWTSAGGRVYFVPSSQDSAQWHHITVDRDGFHCSCAQGTDGRGAHYCTHRALARQAWLAEEHGLQQAETRRREPEPAAPMRAFTVAYEPKRGRLSACSKCHTAFAQGELITLKGKGVAWCAICSTEPTVPGADAPVHRTNSGFSIYKQE